MERTRLLELALKIIGTLEAAQCPLPEDQRDALALARELTHHHGPAGLITVSSAPQA